jgi:hypothetical protein
MIVFMRGRHHHQGSVIFFGNYLDSLNVSHNPNPDEKGEENVIMNPGATTAISNKVISNTDNSR